MALAFKEAAKGLGHTWQNPLVGAVICKHHQLLATGYHHAFGQMHAEINALSHLKNPNDARGATMYVTLEPCSHFGKTPPCAKKLVEVGIKRVVIGQRDPNPIVSGKGIRILETHGIRVTVLGTTGELNRAYNFFFQYHRPLVTLKYAMSLDGKLNGQTNQRTLLTGTQAFQSSQQLRYSQQAILIGEHTLMIDDPELTVRTVIPDYPPIKIILVNQADSLSLSEKIFQSATPVWLLSRKKSTRQWPEFVQVFQSAEWTPHQIMKLLAKKGIQSLMVEGGSRVQAAFAAANLIDQIWLYLAPLVLGGGGLPAVLGLANSTVQQFHLTQIQQLGKDLLITARRN